MNVQTREGKEWLERLMRLGFLANGIVYITIGFLSLRSAFAAGGTTTGSQGALSQLATQPFGQILLVVIGLGMVGLAIWYVVRGVSDPDQKGDDVKGLGKRAGYVIAGLGYGVLAFTAFQLLTGSGGGGGSAAADWTARVMQQPFGRWLVGIVGLVLVGVGAYHVYKAYTTKFREKLKSQQMSREELEWGVRAAQWGLGARGVVFAIIGVFLVQAAVRYNPQEAGGVGQALQELAQQPYGAVLLGVVALGFVGYGLYSGIILTRYRRMNF